MKWSHIDLVAGQRAQRQQPRHEASLRVRFAGRHQLVHLIESG